MTAVISVKLPNPQFEGQTKTKLGNTEVKGIVEAIVNDKLGAFLEENPVVAKRIVMKSVEAARARDAASLQRDLSFASALAAFRCPSAADCQDRGIRPVAFTSFKGHQQVFGEADAIALPALLRQGRSNVDRARLDRMLTPTDQRSSRRSAALGTDEFIIDKLRYHRRHIYGRGGTLAHPTALLTFFYRQMPMLVTGPLYRPPRLSREARQIETFIRRARARDVLVHRAVGLGRSHLRRRRIFLRRAREFSPRPIAYRNVLMQFNAGPISMSSQRCRSRTRGRPSSQPVLQTCNH